MTSVLANAVGPAGEVISVEPHPEVFRRLEANIAQWPQRITSIQAALGPSRGTVGLHVPAGFAVNRGTASVAAAGSAAAAQVDMATLDDLVGERSIGVLKIDVEGFEQAVLSGAAKLLAGPGARRRTSSTASKASDGSGLPTYRCP